MDWPAAITSLGVPAAVGGLVSGLIGFLFNRKLQSQKAESEKELQALRVESDQKLLSLKAESDQELLSLKDAHERIDRLEADLLQSGFLTLTGTLNVFGPTNPLDCGKLSNDLNEWYLSRGRRLTSESKALYFLVQEVLNFFGLRRILPSRPSDELLYSGGMRTIEAVRLYRAARLATPARGDEGSYAFAVLETCVREFKEKCNQSPEKASPEDAWLLLHFVMTAFRSSVMRFIDEVNSRPERKASRAGGGL
jgi:hypothetical protein